MKHFLFILISSALLAGCAKTEAGQAPAHFGNAVRQNIAAQIVHPDAPKNNRALTYSGERAALAQKRYVLDATEKAQAPKSSTAASGGGS